MLRLPQTLLHDTATATRAELLAAVGAESSTSVAVDASALQRFDSAALAVLLELRRAAVQGLVLDRTPQATELLLGLYRNEKEAAVKRQILDHLIGTSSAATLVQLARQETDPAVRKRLVERLSTMKDKEAVDYMMEILKK